MRRMVMRATAATLVAAAASVVAAGAAEAAVDLGAYSSFEACSSDARSNNELGFSGIFYCMWSPNDGRIHQYYSNSSS